MSKYNIKRMPKAFIVVFIVCFVIALLSLIFEIDYSRFKWWN